MTKETHLSVFFPLRTQSDTGQFRCGYATVNMTATARTMAWVHHALYLLLKMKAEVNRKPWGRAMEREHCFSK